MRWLNFKQKWADKSHIGSPFCGQTEPIGCWLECGQGKNLKGAGLVFGGGGYIQQIRQFQSCKCRPQFVIIDGKSVYL